MNFFFPIFASMNFSLKEIFSAFIVMFAVIDILGSVPIIIGMKQSNKHFNPLSAAVISLAILVAFLYLGQALLGLFGVDISSFAVAGALVLLVLAIEMIFGIQIFKDDGPTNSATIVPIVFPLIAGAASLTTLLSLRAEYHNENIIIALLLNIIIVYFVLSNLDFISRKIGKGGIYVMRKFFGIILLAIAVKLIVSNLHTLIS
ncbi:MAG: MarC family protein [Bacteroidales bacterium]|nr:MarC family protein [Bacteroidales bacterium]MDD3990404.1 MarC family protein [Bacteroidales bacterium]